MKGEMDPGRGVKKNLKPYVYSQMESQELDIVLFVERSGELHLQARLRYEVLKPKGNRV